MLSSPWQWFRKVLLTEYRYRANSSSLLLPLNETGRTSNVKPTILQKHRSVDDCDETRRLEDLWSGFGVVWIPIPDQEVTRHRPLTNTRMWLTCYYRFLLAPFRFLTPHPILSNSPREQKFCSGWAVGEIQLFRRRRRFLLFHFNDDDFNHRHRSEEE